jgi:hypothetical protein
MRHINSRLQSQVGHQVCSIAAGRVQPGPASPGRQIGATAGLVAGLIGSLLVGCNQVQPLNPEFTMEIKPTGAGGTYNIMGQTNLTKPPTTVTIQAIRKLRPLANATRLTNREPMYAVVAEDRVETQDGKWQATLKLIQSDSTGTPLESWQINQNQVPLEVEPEGQVSFIAVTAPLDRSIRFVELNGSGAGSITNPVLQSATDGSNYLKAEQSITIAPPTLNRSLAKATDRPVVQVRATASQTVVNSKQSTAPLTSQEFVR